MSRIVSLTIASAVFLAVCLFIGGKYHRSDFDGESSLQAVGLGVMALIGISGLIEAVTIIRWNLRGGEPPAKRRKARPSTCPTTPGGSRHGHCVRPEIS